MIRIILWPVGLVYLFIYLFVMDKKMREKYNHFEKLGLLPLALSSAQKILDLLGRPYGDLIGSRLTNSFPIQLTSFVILLEYEIVLCVALIILFRTCSP
jgi:uncharacterized membrane protein